MSAEIDTYVHSEKILETAEMLFRTKGFDYTTVRDITAWLNVSDSVFFHYFESVDEILELLWSGPCHSRDRKVIKIKSNTQHSFKKR